MFDLTQFNIGGIFNILLQIGLLLTMGIGAIGILFYVNKLGFFIRRPYKLTIHIPRADGRTAKKHALGRKKKNGKFEVAYGFMGMGVKDVTEDIDDEYINLDNTIQLYRVNEDSYYPMKETIDKTGIRLEPTTSPAMKMAYAEGYRENMERFTQPNKIMELIPILSLVMGFFILGIAIYVAFDRVASLGTQFTAVANSLNHVADKFTNATIVKTTAVVTPTTPAPPV